MNDFTGAIVPDTDFGTDDGSASELLRHAMADYVANRSMHTFRTIRDLMYPSRLLVPVVATVDDMHEDTGAEKDSHMSSVSFELADGRKALLAFTGTDSLAMWDPEARPIPKKAMLVAQSALTEDYDAVIIDVAGPVPCFIDEVLLAQVALGDEREVMKRNRLQRVIDGLLAVEHITSASWADVTDESGESAIVISLSMSAPIPELGDLIPALLTDSGVAVAIDTPLRVEVV